MIRDVVGSSQSVVAPRFMWKRMPPQTDPNVPEPADDQLKKLGRFYLKKEINKICDNDGARLYKPAHGAIYGPPNSCSPKSQPINSSKKKSWYYHRPPFSTNNTDRLRLALGQSWHQRVRSTRSSCSSNHNPSIITLVSVSLRSFDREKIPCVDESSRSYRPYRLAKGPPHKGARSSP